VIDLVLIAVAGVLYWAWKTRDPQALRVSDVMAVLAALIGLKMLNSHSPLGVLGVGGAIWWFWIRKSGKLAKPVQSMTHAEARSLLEVPISATPEEIRSAHRRLVARVHPDVGGSADLTRRVNDARDTLLRHRG
jgi:hypothetical protein